MRVFTVQLFGRGETNCAQSFGTHCLYKLCFSVNTTLNVDYFLSGPPIASIKLTVKDITDSSASVSWTVEPTPTYRLSIKTSLWVTHPDGEIKPNLIYLDTMKANMQTLKAYGRYKVQISMAPYSIPGIGHPLSSNEVTFTTNVKGMLTATPLPYVSFLPRCKVTL